MTGFFPPVACLDLPASNSGKTALLMEGQSISFQQLYRQACSIAACLKNLEVDRRNPIAVQAKSNKLFVWALYAARVYDIPILPLGIGMDSARRNQLLRDTNCKDLLTDTDLDDLPVDVRSITSDQIFSPFDRTGFLAQEPLHRCDDVQLIIATSGSEGDPKGVMLSGANIAASVKEVQNFLDLKQDDLWLSCLPLNHIGGISILYRCIYVGACVLLHDDFDPVRIWRELHAHEVTHISLVPAMLASLLEQANGNPPPVSLRWVLVGGASLDPEVASQAQKAGWPLCVSYGMSETASICVGDKGPNAGAAAGCVGHPLDGIEIKLSKSGRVMIRGPAVMLGYANQNMLPGVGLKQDEWFESGDLGVLDSLGNLQVLGRADDILVSGGRNIHPHEVESLLTECPGLDRVAVTGIRDGQWGDILVALYTGNATTAEVEAWSRDHIPSALRPRRFQQLLKLPLNKMGKLERSALSGLISQTE